MKSIDELAADPNFTTAKTGEDRSVTFLPDPPRAHRRYTVISVDDHIVEPPDTFTGRLPRRFADRAPKVVGRGGARYRSTASSRFDSMKCAAVHGISTTASMI